MLVGKFVSYSLIPYLLIKTPDFDDDFTRKDAISKVTFFLLQIIEYARESPAEQRMAISALKPTFNALDDAIVQGRL